MSPTVELCVITDDNYVRPTATMLTSAKCNKHNTSKYRIHLVTVGISAYQKGKLMELSSPDFKIIPVEADVARYEAITAKTYVSKAALVKFTLCDMFPEVDRMLYLDGDIIVRGDLTELYTKDLGDGLIAAVRDIGGEWGLHFNDLVGVEAYINSGVMLMNLAQMRKEGIAVRMIETKCNAPASWSCMDQDSINKVCDGRMLFLPVRYNAMLPMFRCTNKYHLTLEDVNKFYGTAYGSYDELDEDALLVHFAGEGRQRPWLFHNGSYAEQWQEYTAKSPFRSIGQVRDICMTPVLAKEMDEVLEYPPRSYMERHEKKVHSVRFFEFLFIGTICTTWNCKTFKLFGLLPLLTVRYGLINKRWLLFGCVPFLRVKSVK